METDDVESIAASLVREYLSRKGLRTTLAILDEEMPRTEGSVSNRQELIHRLHVEQLVKRNKELPLPHRTILEVMTRKFVEDPSSPQPSHSSRGGGRVGASSSRDNERCLSAQPRPKSSHHKEPRNGHESLILEDASEDGETILGQGKAGIIPKSLEMTGRKKPLRIRGMSGAVSAVDTDRRRRFKATPERLTLRQDAPASNTNGIDPFPTTTLYPTTAPDPVELLGRHSALSVAKPSKFTPTGLGSASRGGIGGLGSSLTAKGSVDEIVDVLAVDRTRRQSGSARLSRHSSEKDEDEEIANCRYDVQQSSISSEKLPIRPSSSKYSDGNLGMASKLDTRGKNSLTIGDVEFDDIDNDLEAGDADLEDHVTSAPAAKQATFHVDSQPINVHTAVDLKMLLFGSASHKFNREWQQQAFTFCDIPGLQYGLIQKKGGSCGIMASVQAHVILHLVFLESDSSTLYKRLSPSKQRQSEVLAEALANIFWKAGQECKATVVIPSMQSYYTNTTRCKTDGLTETLMLSSFTKYEELLSFVKMNVGQFELDGYSGVVLALYSAILSRTVEGVKNDMDEPNNKLMGAHSYCSQDMVNLFLTGRARSNVFNDVMELENDTGPALVLKGIDCRQNIGFLSLFEHYESCQVGTYMKTPKYPIWVICSESHFSVLFCLKKELMNDWKVERRFELYYYDGLARQDQEIKLSIDTTNRFFQPPSDNELVPPLDMCIRTKWKDAEIDWNGTEPLL